MARVVFIKSIKKVEASKSFVSLKTLNQSQIDNNYSRPDRRMVQFHQSPSSAGSASSRLTDEAIEDQFYQ